MQLGPQPGLLRNPYILNRKPLCKGCLQESAIRVQSVPVQAQRPPTCSDTGGAGVLNAAGVLLAGGPITVLATAPLPPVLTGSSTVMVSGGLSPPPPPAAAAFPPAAAAAASAPPRRVAALGGAGVLKLLLSAVLAGACLAVGLASPAAFKGHQQRSTA